MTSAHRPTFDHAKGKSNTVSSTITHKRALASHSKLKFRNKKIKKNSEFEEDAKDDERDFSEGRKIDGLEKEDVLKLKNDLTNEKGVIASNNDNNELNLRHNDDASDNACDNKHQSDEESSGEEDSDDEEALLREVELIKKEREDARQKVEEEIVNRALLSNPLIKLNDSHDSEDNNPKKKSWRSNKTMSKKLALSEKDKFTNDTLKSDFHKDFLDKYIK